MGLILQVAHLPHAQAVSCLTEEEQLSSVALSRGSINSKIGTFPVASRHLGEMTITSSPHGPVWVERQLGGVLLQLFLFKQVWIKAIHTFTF